MMKAEFLENGRNKIIDKSNQEFFTDIAKKFGGYDETGSPSDLLVAALITCVMSTIESKARILDINVSGLHAKGDKIVEDDKITKFVIEYHLPESLSAEHREKLEGVAKRCFVGKQLHPDIEKDFTFIYDVK